MRYVKFKQNFFDILGDKEYEIKFETDLELCIIDETGEIQTHFKAGFEIIDRPVMVKMVRELELIKILDKCPDEMNYLCKDKDGNYFLYKKRHLEFPQETLTLEQRIEKLEQIINNK